MRIQIQFKMYVIPMTAHVHQMKRKSAFIVVNGVISIKILYVTVHRYFSNQNTLQFLEGMSFRETKLLFTMSIKQIFGMLSSCVFFFFFKAIERNIYSVTKSKLTFNAFSE